MLNQSFYLFATRLFGYALRLVVPYFLVRQLSVADFGAYRQFFLMEVYADALFQLGLNQALYYFIPRDLRNAGAYLLNSIVMNCLIFSVAFGLLGMFSHQVSSWLNMAIVHDAFGLLAAYIAVKMLVASADAYLTARQCIRAAGLFDVAGQAMSSVACVIAAFATRDLMVVLTALAVARAIQLVGMVAYIQFWLHGFRAERYFFGIGAQIRYGFVLGMAGTLMTQLARLHDFFVSRYYGTEAYAVYSAGCTEIPVIQLFTQSVALVALGQFALLDQQGDWEGTRRLWRRVLTSSYAVTIPAVILFLVLARPIIGTMFTDAYLAAVPVFAINTVLKIGLVFNATLVLRAMRRNDITIWVNAVSLVVAIPLLYAGMKVGGTVGIIAAQAALVIGSRLVSVAVMNRMLPESLPYFVSPRELRDFYVESWRSLQARLRARRAAPARDPKGEA
jgi:O-antigen/teichoic acid export membrane protein